MRGHAPRGELSGSAGPGGEQGAQITTIGGAVAVKVARSWFSEQRQQKTEVSTIDKAVTVKVG